MDIVLAEGLTGYKVLHDQSDYAVLAYENEDILQNGILKFDDNAKTQLQNAWVAFPDEPICYLNAELYIPNVTVTDFEGNELVKGTDYTVYLYPEDLVKGGVYCLVVEGTGYYNGKVFALTTLAFCKGDVNGDSYIDNLDAAMILKYDAGIIELEPTAETSGDVNSDGFVDNLDAAMILKYDAGIIDSFAASN